MLIAGSLPDAGKSNGVNQILAHAALCPDVGLWLFDGKENELTTWTPLADRVVGHDMDAALDAVADLQRILDGRLAELAAAGLEKVTPDSGHGFVLVVVDELALYTSVYGEPAQQKRFSAGLRDLVARGRAAGLIVVAATQRPSSDIVPTSLRDLFAYRWALACANDASSDVILGDGYANAGYSAATIDLDGHAGVGYLLAENRRTPRLFRGRLPRPRRHPLPRLSRRHTPRPPRPAATDRRCLMTTPARSFPLGPVLDGHIGGELVQSLTYRETYSPAAAHHTWMYDPPARHRHTPGPLRAAAGAAWALVSIATAGSVLVVLVLVLVQILGWLT
jgi:DNA segregation ATPase FtsK/SpoIIIE, S-DNA-T family